MKTLIFNQIIQETKNDKNFSLNYLKELFIYNMNVFDKPIVCNNPLSAIKSFIPLPTRFLLSEIYSGSNKIIKLHNEYQFHGKPGHRLLFSDKLLPLNKKPNIKFPIPFSFPVYSHDSVEILQSNIYYYEVSITNKVNLPNSNFNSPCVSIGFGSKAILFESHVGWHNDSIGFHSDDGTIRYNEPSNKAQVVSKSWVPGDIAGAGMIWIGENKVKFFFTLNGRLVWISHKVQEINKTYFPIIGYDHPNSINVNFSSSKFKFDIKKMIGEHSKQIISTENTFIETNDIGLFLNEYPIVDKIIKIIEFNNIFNSLNNATSFFNITSFNNIFNNTNLSIIDNINNITGPSITSYPHNFNNQFSTIQQLQDTFSTGTIPFSFFNGNNLTINPNTNLSTTMSDLSITISDNSATSDNSAISDNSTLANYETLLFNNLISNFILTSPSTVDNSDLSPTADNSNSSLNLSPTADNSNSSLNLSPTADNSTLSPSNTGSTDFFESFDLKLVQPNNSPNDLINIINEYDENLTELIKKINGQIIQSLNNKENEDIDLK